MRYVSLTLRRCGTRRLTTSKTAGILSRFKQKETMSKQTQAVLAGRMIGVFRLRVLITRCNLEKMGIHGRGPSAFKILKRELGCKGSNEGVLRYAKEVLASVKDW